MYHFIDVMCSCVGVYMTENNPRGTGKRPSRKPSKLSDGDETEAVKPEPLKTSKKAKNSQPNNRLR